MADQANSSTLASHDLARPARAQRLLAELMATCQGWLQEPVLQSLDAFDRRLFEQAERARNHLDQQRHFTVRQRLIQSRQPFLRHCLAGLVQHFHHLGQASPRTGKDAFEQPLSLVDPGEQELAALLDQLSSRCEARMGPGLLELGYRFAVLVASPPLDGEALPVGPRAMLGVWRDAGQALDLSGEHLLLMLRCAESGLLKRLPELHARLDAQLHEAAILRGLRVLPLARLAAQRARTIDSPPGEPAAEAPPTATAAADRGGDASAPIAVLEGLRSLLARRQLAEKSPPSTTAQVATREELETALAALQQHLGQISTQVSRELRSARRLRDELLQQLNAARPAGSPPRRLSAEQDDAVELLAMLFEQLARQLRQGGQAQQLLGGLQLPLLRAAITDRQFFEQREHPARQLLGTVAEAANDWLDQAGSEADRQLATALQHLVQRAGQGQPDNQLFAALTAEIEQHLTQLKRKAQAAERRHVEAMQGRERLAQARRRAAELIADRFAKTSPSGLLRTLLERVWSDVLALTLLRHGEQSELFATQLVITDQLLGRLPLGDRRRLQSEVCTALQQIGMHGEEALQVAQRLTGAAEAASTGPAGVSGLALRLRQQRQKRDREPSPPPATSAAAPAAAAPVVTPSPAVMPAAEATDEERQVLAQLQTLPFGTWFEIIDAKSGAVSQRKLAWYSPMSGNGLFVTRRGQRAEEITLLQLARDMVRGQVRRLDGEAGSLLDRAWRALGRQLRRSGDPGEPSHAS